jgi:peptidoglycan-N-acetylglucosamine deacetylase
MRGVIIGFAVVAPLALLWWPWGIAILLFSHGLLMFAILSPNVQWLGPVITAFEPRGKEVWLTIDDGPADDTMQLLDALNALEVKATFFVKGTLARRRPELVRAMVERGHSVANHSDTHPSGTFWCLPPAAIAREIDGGIESTWFRAPVGMKNPFVHPALQRRGMRLIGWSVRGFDGVRTDIDRVAARILPHVFPGAIVVLHQGRASSVQCIGRVVGELRARGYSFVVPEDTRLKTKR